MSIFPGATESLQKSLARILMSHHISDSLEFPSIETRMYREANFAIFSVYRPTERKILYIFILDRKIHLVEGKLMSSASLQGPAGPEFCLRSLSEVLGLPRQTVFTVLQLSRPAC